MDPEGDPILSRYFSTSGGRTEDALSVWGGEHPYLTSVESPHEDHSPYNLTRHRFTWAELAGLLGLDDGALRALAADQQQQALRVTERTDTGRVSQVHIAGESYCALELRRRLDLPSTWWEPEKDSEGVTLTARGFGHGVGMSQYGADGMAQRGYSFREIIAHYYPDTSLQSLTDLDKSGE